MIDCHSHLLPAIDDGASTLEESLRMAEAYTRHGFRAVCVTPHIRAGMFDNSEEEIRAAVGHFREELKQAKIDLTIFPGAEYYYDDHLIEKIQTPSKLLTLADRHRHLLIEFNPLVKPLSLRQIVFQLKVNGITPIMAHPERYGFLDGQSEWLEGLIEGGLLLQGTLSPLSGLWGGGTRKRLKDLLDQDSIHLISSDLHKFNQVDGLLEKAVEKLREWTGSGRAANLLTEIPSEITGMTP